MAVLATWRPPGWIFLITSFLALAFQADVLAVLCYCCILGCYDSLDEWRVQVIEPGRVLLVTCSGAGGLLAFLAAHVDPAAQMEYKRHLFYRIMDALALLPRHCIFLLGGWSIPATGEDLLDLQFPLSQPRGLPISRLFDSTFSRFTELHQPDHTRRGTCDGGLRFFSRIDCLYVNLASPDIIDCSPSPFLYGPPSSRFLHSDHCPVVSRLHAPRTSPPASPRLLSWAAKHDYFPDCVTAVLNDVRLPTDPWGALSVYKICLLEAGRRQQG